MAMRFLSRIRLQGSTPPHPGKVKVEEHYHDILILQHLQRLFR
jgi:hypothetical protein